MSQVPNNVKSLAARLLNTAKTATPNQGFGGLGAWPNEALCQPEEIECELTSVVFNWAAKFKYGGAENRPATEIAALEVQCFYTWHGDSTGQPLAWKGAPCTIPYEQNGLPKNQGDRVRIAAERLNGQILGLTGTQYDDWSVAQKVIDELLNNAKAAGSAVWVKVFKNMGKREDKKTKQTRINKEDFIREVISGGVQAEASADATTENHEDPEPANAG